MTKMKWPTSVVSERWPGRRVPFLAKIVALVLSGCGAAVSVGYGDGSSSGGSPFEPSTSGTSVDATFTGQPDPTPPGTTGSSESGSQESSSSDSTGGPPVDVCRALPNTAEVSVLAAVEDGWDYHRDFAMTGNGTFITQDGAALVEVDGAGQVAPWLNLPEPLPDFTMLRPLADGTLLGSSGASADLLLVSPSGLEPVAADFSPGFPVGIFVRPDGGAWVTDTPADRLLRYAADTGVEVVLELAKGSRPFEVYEDSDRERLYWTASGVLWTVPLGGGVLGAPSIVYESADDWIPGLARDTCGNYYVLAKSPLPEHGNQKRLVRLELNAEGEAVDDAVELIGFGDLGSSLARLRFGFGFDSGLDRSLFTEGEDATILAIDVGIEGAVAGTR